MDVLDQEILKEHNIDIGVKFYEQLFLTIVASVNNFIILEIKDNVKIVHRIQHKTYSNGEEDWYYEKKNKLVDETAEINITFDRNPIKDESKFKIIEFFDMDKYFDESINFLLKEDRKKKIIEIVN